MTYFLTFLHRGLRSHSRSKCPEKVSWVLDGPSHKTEGSSGEGSYLLTLLDHGFGCIVRVDSFFGGSLGSSLGLTLLGCLRDGIVVVDTYSEISFAVSLCRLQI